jgi:hypothetical protein
MPRSRFLRIAALAGLVFGAAPLTGRAGSLPADALPLPNRVATADLTVAGKVTAFEEKTVLVAPAGAREKTEYTIAVITISDPLTAPKDWKTVRLGFVPPAPNVAIRPTPYYPAIGHEGIFFLAKHPEADFYVAYGPLAFHGKNTPTFEKDLALVKQSVKALEDPITALKGKTAEGRFLAAAVLVAHYRTPKTPKPSAEPINAEQSKLILQALAGADWTPPTDITKLSPYMVLWRLPLTEKDGWNPPKDQKALGAYAQEWLKNNAEKYRIQSFVPEKGK